MIDSIIAALNDRGSDEERDLSRIGSPPYKPFYRTIVILVSDEDIWDEYFDGEMPTEEQAKTVLGRHPWFDDAIRNNKDEFEMLFEHLRETWVTIKS